MTGNLNNLHEAPQGSKRVLIKFVGGLRPPEELMVVPGSTTGDLLRTLGLDGMNFCLNMGGPDSVLANDENVYTLVNDGALLYAGSLADAGE